MKIKVLHEKCQGHARCYATAPDLFKLNDEDGYILPGDIDVPPGQEDLARKGVRSCPERALKIDKE